MIHAATVTTIGRLSLVLLGMASTAVADEQAPGVGPIQVLEVVSWNEGRLRDRDGKSPDWIELANVSSQRVSLEGYTLSDDPTKPEKSRLPSGSLAPGERIVVFASGDSSRSSTTEFHLDFKISTGGESIVVSGPEGSINDQVEVLPVTLPDISQGRLPSDPRQWRYFAEPTPADANPDEGFSAISVPIGFSHEAGLYEAPFNLSLESSPGAEIRYTIDGAEPASSALLYGEPLEVLDRSDEANGISLIEGTSIANQHTDGWFPPRGLVPKAFTVRARSIQPDALPGPISTRTYFVGAEGPARWQLPVVSLVSDPDGLFDYERGIYMLGKAFDDYRDTHPNAPLTGHTPANYTQRGPDWSRLGHFEYFEADGQLGHRQNIALDIQGQSSRSFRQKSLGLKPRGDISPKSSFHYPFFSDLKRRGLEGQRESFDGLRLRNGGNDWEHAMMRDALAHRLAAPLGIDVMTPQPVVVFLNGEFWGLYYLREQGDRDSISIHYGVPKNDLVIAESNGSVKEGEPGDAESYAELLALVGNGGLEDAAKFGEVASRMDVRNFLNYQLAEIYLGNRDWPHNNVRFWRDLHPENRPLSENPGADGRWRWMLFDADLAYGHPWTTGVGEDTLAVALNPEGRPGVGGSWSTALLVGLMENSEFRIDFINSMADHLNSVFSSARAGAEIDRLIAEISPVMPDQLDRWRTSKGSISWWKSNVRVLEGFARQRPLVLRRQLPTVLGTGRSTDVTIAVSPPQAGIVTIHRLRLDSTTPGVPEPVYPWEGEYFEGVPITVRAEARPGYTFLRWADRTEGFATFETTLSGPAKFTAIFERKLPGVISGLRTTEDDTVTFLFTGQPGTEYQLQWSADLRQWEDRETFTTLTTGRAQVESPLTESGFLRVVSVRMTF